MEGTNSITPLDNFELKIIGSNFNDCRITFRNINSTLDINATDVEIRINKMRAKRIS
ncbi:MAG: hypothetical protein ABJB76_08810 [Candidatus Nitrosocosmicus sp.]